MYHQGNTLFRWRKVFRLPQTYFLIVGIVLGYLSFIIWLGIRPLTLIIGGLIALLMLLAWIWQLKQIQRLVEDNLLEPEVFLTQLKKVEEKLIKQSSPQWQQTLNLAKETQVFAQEIADQEPVLTPELLETLYTVIALSNQVAQATLALKQIQTETYRNLTEQHLQTSRQRLQDTHNQLQHLHDQVLLSSLESSEVRESLPNRLRSLIVDNKTTLQSLIDDSSISDRG